MWNELFQHLKAFTHLTLSLNTQIEKALTYSHCEEGHKSVLSLDAADVGDCELVCSLLIELSSTLKINGQRKQYFSEVCGPVRFPGCAVSHDHEHGFVDIVLSDLSAAWLVSMKLVKRALRGGHTIISYWVMGLLWTASLIYPSPEQLWRNKCAVKAAVIEMLGILKLIALGKHYRRSEAY